MKVSGFETASGRHKNIRVALIPRVWQTVAKTFIVFNLYDWDRMIKTNRELDPSFANEGNSGSHCVL